MSSLLPTDTCFNGPNTTTFGVIPAIVAGLISTIVQKACDLDKTSEYPADIGFDFLAEYDFIIIGAGSSGSVIANRLSEVSEWNILLVEAGDDPSIASDVPILELSLHGSNEDWKFKYQPNSKASLGLKDGVALVPAGKALGGSSTINGMKYVRGNRGDYNGWSELGFKSWNYENVLLYFKKSENFTTENEYHSRGGYLNVERKNEQSEAEEKLLRAASQMGNAILDTNEGSQLGYEIISFTTNNGMRESTAKAFLVPIKNRGNLHVMKRGLAKHLQYDASSNAITGLKILKDGITVEVRAKKEIILSAGAVGSPHLLMVSGLGPADVLDKAGVTVVKDMPGVGQNLQDHPLTFGFVFALTKFDLKQDSMHNFFEFLMTGSHSQSEAIKVMGYISTPSNPNPEETDIQLMHLLMPVNSSGFDGFIKLINFNEDITEILRTKNKIYPLLIIIATLMRPKSRGRIEITSPNIIDKPTIFGNLLEDVEDVEVLQYAAEYVMSYSKTEDLQSMGAEYVPIVPSCSDQQDVENKSAAYWECVIRHTATSAYHLAGTCSMGVVVDEQLRAVGVAGLRVADASVMPAIVSGNTNAACIMIGEKASDDIKRSWS